jgi:hypothetical protein
MECRSHSSIYGAPALGADEPRSSRMRSISFKMRMPCVVRYATTAGSAKCLSRVPMISAWPSTAVARTTSSSGSVRTTGTMTGCKTVSGHSLKKLHEILDVGIGQSIAFLDVVVVKHSMHVIEESRRENEHVRGLGAEYQNC